LGGAVHTIFCDRQDKNNMSFPFPLRKNGGRDINQQKLNSDGQQMTWTRKTIPHHQMKLMYGIRKIIYPKIADREYFPWPQFQGSKIVVKIKINNPFLFTFVAMCIIF
jgi:hypothetical protein